MLYYGLIYLVLANGIIVWGKIAKALTRQIFTLQKRAVEVHGRVKTTEIM
jgi:hypothetical protein